MFYSITTIPRMRKKSQRKSMKLKKHRQVYEELMNDFVALNLEQARDELVYDQLYIENYDLGYEI